MSSFLKRSVLAATLALSAVIGARLLAAAPTKEFDARWGSPELFINNAYRGMWGHVRELGGIV